MSDLEKLRNAWMWRNNPWNFFSYPEPVFLCLPKQPAFRRFGFTRIPAFSLKSRKGIWRICSNWKSFQIFSHTCKSFPDASSLVDGISRIMTKCHFYNKNFKMQKIGKIFSKNRLKEGQCQVDKPYICVIFLSGQNVNFNLYANKNIPQYVTKLYFPLLHFWAQSEKSDWLEDTERYFHTRVSKCSILMQKRGFHN